jgi:hypothetical protein
MLSDSFQFAGRDGEDRQCTYERNIPVRSSDHCCNGRAVSIIHYECVFVTLGIQYSMLMCHIVTCGLSDSKIFFHIIS